MSLLVTNAEPETSRNACLRAFAADVELVQNFSLFHQEYSHRPSLISVRIDEPFSDYNLGLEFRSVCGTLLIESISPDSPLSSSPLRTGDRLISFDQNPNVTHWTATQAEGYIREKQGKISFIVHNKNGDPGIVEAVVYRSSPHEKIGVTLQRVLGQLKIGDVSGAGLLGNSSVVCPGDFVVAINDIDVIGLDASLAGDILDSSTGMITLRTAPDVETEVSIRGTLEDKMNSMIFSEDIVATTGKTKRWDPEPGSTKRDDFSFLIRPGFMSLKVYKPSMETDLEFSFVTGDDGQLQIGSVLKQGMLGKSPLAPGLIVQSIGYVRCNKWSPEQALAVVRSGVGELLFLLQDPLGDNSHALAMVYKSTPRSSIGLEFKSADDRLRIVGVESNGLFWDSLLNEGDSVIAINTVPCGHLTPTEAHAITHQIPERVMVLVKLLRTNCILVSWKSQDLGHREDTAGSAVGSQNATTSKGCMACFATVVASISPTWSQ